MADRYRKGDKERVSINCTVAAETKLFLIEMAGEFAIGYAIEQLVERHRQALKRSKNASKVQPNFASR